MEKQAFSESKNEGRKVWFALEKQWAEAMGFFGAMLYSLIWTIKKHLVGLILFAIIFGAIGGALSFVKKQVYYSEMTVSYAQLEKKIYGDMLFKLNQLVSSKQYESLAKLLKLDVNQVSKIHSIDSKNIHNQPLVNDISVEKVPFYITVEVYNQEVLKELQKALVNYLSVSGFVHERLLLNERNYTNEIIHMKNQMIYMDSLKVLLLRDCSNLDADAVINLEKLNKEQNGIFGRIRDLEAALQFNKNIEVMDGFIAQKIPFSKIVMKYILLGMITGICIRIFLLIIKQ
jgi:hypothetical protein